VAARVVPQDVARPSGGFERVDLSRRADQFSGQEGKVADVRPHIDEGQAHGDMGEKERRDVFFDGALTKYLASAPFRKDDPHLLSEKGVRSGVEGDRYALRQPQERGINEGCGRLVEEPAPPRGVGVRHHTRERVAEIGHIHACG
jgi:hypothetical protein